MQFPLASSSSQYFVMITTDSLTLMGSLYSAVGGWARSSAEGRFVMAVTVYLLCREFKEGIEGLEK